MSHNQPQHLKFHRRQLQAWLADYQNDRTLRQPMAAAEVPVPSHEPISADKTSPPADGQIRLLPSRPVSMPSAEFPLFVLLMPAQADDSFTVIPFSRYILPATPREWRTGLRRRPLRILCLWNITVRHTHDIHKSWFIEALPQAKQQQIAQHLQQPLPLDQYAPRQFGPPLLHPLDPRQAYLQEARMLFQDLLPTSTGNTIEYPTLSQNQRYLKAAEPPENYSTSHDQSP